MNDLERIEEIEKAFGFALNRVELENLFEEKSFPVFDDRGVRNYSVDENGSVTGLALDFCPLVLLPDNFLSNFNKLQKLELKKSYLPDYSFIRELKSLTSLDLSHNQISDASFVKELKSLTSLDLGDNQISDASFITELKSLTSLGLSDNQISDYSFVKELKSLTSLDLSFNEISDASFITELKSLTSLDLSDNQISDASFIKELKSLTSLDLSDNQISDASFITELKSLTSLNLNLNKISDASFVRELKSLTSLSLGTNDLKDVSFLKNLKSLTSLILWNNQISNISFLEELKSLTSLFLSSNQISDGSFIRELKSLASLDLSHNQISDASFIKELKSLTSLDLGSNQISDASFVKELKSLTSLDLNLNKISDASFVRELKSLTSLYLDGNKNIDLPKNLVNEPYSALSREGIDAIRRHYEQIEAHGTDHIYEAKVLIVGEPGAGKTTLRRKLKDHNYFPQEATEEEKASTVGVEIVTLEFPYNEKPEITFTANLWDFGGQKIQYILHQYFFTQRSLYVLLADDRRQLTNFHYWFEIIGTLGKDCPVLVVLNEINHQSVTNFDISEYKREFGTSLKSIAEKEVDFSKTDIRFKSLDEEIKHKLCSLEHIGKPLPAQWIPIREELGKIQEQKAYIGIDEYYEICRKHKVENKDYQKDILHYFHDLGIALNYETDKNLRGILILSPNWVIDALYVVLRNKTVKVNNGRFSEEEVFKLWEKDYNRKDSETLLRLMEKGKFEVAYQIGKTDEYIVPALLPSVSPEYDFDGENALQIYFQYKFMPPGILSRLVVRLHENIVWQNGEQIVWEKGMLLEYKESTAEIIESEYQKQIQIKVSGANPIHNKELATIIRNDIQKVHKDWFDNRLIFDEFVPCICRVCKVAEDKKFYKLSVLEGKIGRRKPTIECDQSDEDVNIRELLEGVYVEDKSKEKDFRKKGDTYHTYNIDNRIKIEDGSQNTVIQDSRDFEFTQNINADIDKKLETFFSKLTEFQKHEMELLAQEIVDFLGERIDKLSPQLQANFETAKKGEWKTKFKLAVPLIKYLGINLEAEKEINSDEVVSGIRKLLYGKEEIVLSILNSQTDEPQMFLT